MSIKDLNTLQYIVERLEGCDFHKTFKILYFANQKHLIKYGRAISDDSFFALPFGPVPTQIYDNIKSLVKHIESDIPDDLLNYINIEEDNIIVATSSPQLDIFSESEIECLIESIDENAHLSFSALKNKSHGSAWQNSRGGRISIFEIAKEAGANEDMLKYISFVQEKSLPISR